MEIRRIAVVGAGTMGRGIIQTAVAHGFEVVVAVLNEHERTAARAALQAAFQHAIARGRVGGQTLADLEGRMSWTTELDHLASADFVIEAASEDEQVKCEIFQRLDQVCGLAVILATNTSSISISRLAGATHRADRVLGMHFFNPVPVMSPVEIVRGAETSPATLDATRQLAERLGKVAFVVADRPGFVVNRVLMPLINEAAYALLEGVADANTIDSLLKLGCNHPMGPLQLADLIGLDVCLSILNVLHRDLNDSKFRPCPLLAQLVEAGRLGCKTGRGFHVY